ncbi:MAG TPA: YdcF family protein [Ramlibacter sp.]|jgi:uncharacterized SAM-binding protein YcdF (DUF218 family)|nr:YdcF family protein [Ramlibacter sp.]
MLPGEWKPVLSALVLPPAGPLLLALLGVLLAMRRRGFGLFLAFVGIVLGYLLSTHGMALVLARALTPQVAAAQLQQVRQQEAIVVLGGGVDRYAPQYGSTQMGRHSYERLRYGAFLARRTGRPLAFSGGQGWAGSKEQEPEAVVARRVLHDDWGIAMRWVEDASRDTAENADLTAKMLRASGVKRVAVVTDAIHMPRAAAEFRRAGLEVLPAPTAFPQPGDRPVLEWLPSVGGVELSHHVLREWLGRQVARKR